MLTPRTGIPVYLKSGPPLVLTGLKIKLFVMYLVRARSVLYLDKRTNATHMAELVRAEGGSTRLPSEDLLVCLPKLPSGVPTTFLTFNLACEGQWMEVKYRVTVPGDTLEIKDAMKGYSYTGTGFHGRARATAGGLEEV